MKSSLRPASTILLLAPASPQFRVLMIKRHSKARFMANAYVFPGGCVDEEDHKLGASNTLLKTSSLPGHRVAALRELMEETGCKIQKDNGHAFLCKDHAETTGAPFLDHATQLTPFAHWITPKQEKYRYDTWFFLHVVQPEAVNLPVFGDPKEVADLKWVSPSEAMALHLQSEQESHFRLPPPTFLLLHQLASFPSLESLVEFYSSRYNDKSKEEDRTTILINKKMPAVEPVIKVDLEKKYLHFHVPCEGFHHLAKGEYEFQIGLGEELTRSMVHVGSPIAISAFPPTTTNDAEVNADGKSKL